MKCFIALVFLILGSCALKPIPSAYDYVKKERVSMSDLGDGKVLIYNAAGWKHTIDNTARVNLWIDQKEAGQIRDKEYVIYNLDLGTRGFKLLHIDFIKFNTTHAVKVNKSTKVIMIEPTVFSNNVQIVNLFPHNFEEFKPIYQRQNK
jgi:hypothetical protein